MAFDGDPRTKQYLDAVSKGRATAYVSGPNMSEFYYKTCQKLGKQTADTWYYRAMESGFNIVNGETLARLAGLQKCKNSDILSLSDCFALALASMQDALLLTTDSAMERIGGARVKRFVPSATPNH